MSMVWIAICGGLVGTATVIWLVMFIRKDERQQHQMREDAAPET